MNLSLTKPKHDLDVSPDNILHDAMKNADFEEQMEQAVSDAIKDNVTEFAPKPSAREHVQSTPEKSIDRVETIRNAREFDLALIEQKEQQISTLTAETEKTVATRREEIEVLRKQIACCDAFLAVAAPPATKKVSKVSTAKKTTKRATAPGKSIPATKKTVGRPRKKVA